MNRPLWMRFGVAPLAVLAAFAVAKPLRAESSRVVLVEEHWELRIAQPDFDRSAPQITMVMSPTGNLGDIHFLFTLNHGSAPEYAPGGLQVQHWNGEEFVTARTVQESVTLDHEEEVIHWTQRLWLQDGHLKFQIREGESQTWGNFGGDGLTLNLSTSQTALNSYRPSVSLTESQVNYAENRVASLTLTKLVWVTVDGQVHEQNAPIPIDISLEE